MFCVALGIPILTASLTVHQYTVRYEDKGAFAALDSDAQQDLLWRNADAGVPIDVAVQIDSTLDPPVRECGGLGKDCQTLPTWLRPCGAAVCHL